jgi:ADP-heptose:LPS heptosyltransferase
LSSPDPAPARPWRGGAPPRRLAVLRALKLGDLLCAVPTFRALRAAWPAAEIVLVGLPWAAEFAGRFRHYLDGFRELPGWPGLPERDPEVTRIPVFLAAMQAERFDLAIQLHGSGRFVNDVVMLFGAARTAGFFLPGDHRPDPDLFMPWPDRGLETRRLLALAQFLGLPLLGEELEFPLRAEDQHAVAATAGDLRPGEYVCVHPGASVPERRWPVGQFAAVADALAGHGLAVVLTGCAEEAHLTRSVARAMRTPALDLAGKTDLGACAVLLAGARLLVCNDTGVSHLAAAVRTPSVVLSTSHNSARWAPADRRRHRVLCTDRGVQPEQVARAAVRLLRVTSPRTDRGAAEAAAPAVAFVRVAAPTDPGSRN